MTRVIICDDHPIVREGLRMIIQQAHDLVLDAEANNGFELLQMLKQRTCDVLVTDLSFPEGPDGLDLGKTMASGKRKVTDTKPDEAFATQQRFRYVSLEELVTQSDIITLHAPYMKETHHLINEEIFSRMKKGAILINTARGELVDTHALLAALRDGTLWGAGFDVLESAEPALNQLLVAMPNVVATPHIAFETAEAMDEIDRATAQSIGNFISGIQQPYL